MLPNFTKLVLPPKPVGIGEFWSSAGDRFQLLEGYRRMVWGMDWDEMNRLAEKFGVHFEVGELFATSAFPEREHPLLAGQPFLSMLANNAVPFTMESGQVLAESMDEPVMGLVDYGDAGGQVLVLADVGMLGFAGLEPSDSDNFEFLRNLARYARGR
jgi:hypothetical protein